MEGFMLRALPDAAHAFFCGKEGTKPRPFFAWPYFQGLTPAVRAAAACIPREEPLHVQQVIGRDGGLAELRLFSRDLADPAPSIEVFCRLEISQDSSNPLQLCIELVCRTDNACACARACACSCACARARTHACPCIFVCAQLPCCTHEHVCGCVHACRDGLRSFLLRPVFLAIALIWLFADDGVYTAVS